MQEKGRQTDSEEVDQTDPSEQLLKTEGWMCHIREYKIKYEDYIHIYIYVYHSR